MSRLFSYFSLLRPWQYYKNLLILFGIVFSGNLFNSSLYVPLALGFLSLCLISSANYIINDLKDIEKDKQHPEKRMSRPLAAGTISVLEAVILLIFTFIGSFLLVFILPIDNLLIKILFCILLLTIFGTSQLYTFYFKNIALFDVTFISFNYIWRAISGVIIINVYLSPWLFSLGFLFALFLALSKRRGDLVLLGDSARKQRKVFTSYTLPLIDQYITIVSATMIVSWAIYIIESSARTINIENQNHNLALLTIPLVTITVMKLVMLLQNNDKSARKAELIFLDPEILILGFGTALLILLSIYWGPIETFILALV